MNDAEAIEKEDNLQSPVLESSEAAAGPATQPDDQGKESAHILDEVAQIRLELAQNMNQIGSRLQSLETALETVTRQVSFLPPQVRGLSSKVEGLGSLITESHYQALLLRLLSLYDLVSQMTIPAHEEIPPLQDKSNQTTSPIQDILVLKTQLRQILEANGLTEIEASGAFNPELHRSIRQVPFAEPSQAGQIVDVIRPGFRSERSVLRFAEVSVGVYTPIKSDPE